MSWSYNCNWTYLNGLVCLPASLSLSDFTDVSCTALTAVDAPFTHVDLWDCWSEGAIQRDIWHCNHTCIAKIMWWHSRPQFPHTLNSLLTHTHTQYSPHLLWLLSLSLFSQLTDRCGWCQRYQKLSTIMQILWTPATDLFTYFRYKTPSHSSWTCLLISAPWKTRPIMLVLQYDMNTLERL